MSRLIGVLAVAALLNACSNKEVYNSLQGAKENECRQIVDADARTRCFDNARTSYDNYKQQREESSKN